MKLIFHLPEGKVETFDIEKESITIGRGVVCDVVLPYEGFSRKHAQIDIVNGEVFVTDLGSTNGVFIDGDRIPPGIKKQIQSFFNLQIGPASQVEVIDEDATNPEIILPVVNKRAERAGPETNARVNRPEQTRTTRMDPSLLKASPRKKPVKEEKKSSLMFLPILIFAGAAYYYYFMDNNEEVPEAALVEQAAPVVVPLTETDFLSKAVLDSMYKDANCSQAVWCEDARVMTANKEGVVIDGKTLLVYLNMDAAINETHAAAFNSLELNKRLEILALRRIFNSNLLRSFLRQTALDTVQVVAGTIKEDQYSPFVAFKFKRDLDPAKIEKFYIFGVFDQVLNEGKDEGLIDISLLYDKLDF